MGVGEYVVNESNCQGNMDSRQNTNIYCRVFASTAQAYKWYCSTENSGIIKVTKYEN